MEIILRPFDRGDWDSYAGVESDNPQIANFKIEGRDVDLIIEETMVGIYVMETDAADSPVGEQYIREFGRNDSDEFYSDLNIGLLFGDWLIQNISESTTFWELTNRFGLISV